VYSWGCNTNGELGNGHNENQSLPVKIDRINEYRIKKISCGPNHSMLLTDNGEILVFGSNQFGQIGDEDKFNRNIPFKLDTDITFIDIIADNKYSLDMSIGLSEDEYYYIWGHCGQQSIYNPIKTYYKICNELLYFYSKLRVTYRAYYFKQKYENLSIISRLRQSFNREEYSDFKFKMRWQRNICFDTVSSYGLQSLLYNVCTKCLARIEC
jgi:hypothetical protein